MNYCCNQIKLHWNIFIQIKSSAKCWLDIYYWGAGLEMSGWIQDTGQKVLQSSFQTGSSSSLSYFQIFFLIAFLKEALIRNMTIILWINNSIIICITNSNATINNNYGRLQDLILHFKVPIGTQKKKFGNL